MFFIIGKLFLFIEKKIYLQIIILHKKKYYTLFMSICHNIKYRFYKFALKMHLYIKMKDQTNQDKFQQGKTGKTNTYQRLVGSDLWFEDKMINKNFLLFYYNPVYLIFLRNSYRTSGSI
ncbi:hypothetical protein EDEG_00731 [Edhazardia aedis USNM 41457]|uniref:Uncharacterized protein n=1 Tax=Edhazardia aedis (strain USNM 41457) TaxID=1003232 RepID=J9DCK8_EDHAE|nr:hypothetical protein EDEG_00731 [Edhazardia aedis USNM 41457]|eukprot:EJW05199.1 hypothetical protein EDEG_00731 [Edhazardia aedis USNM 41457]